MDEPTAASVVALVSALVARATTTAAATTTHTRGRRPPLPKPAARARLALDAATLIAGLRPGFLVDYGGPAFRDQAGLAALAAGLTSLLLAREGGSGSVRLARLGGGDGDGGGDDDDGDDDGFSSAPALFLVRLPMECAPLRSPWPVFVGLTPAAAAVWGADAGALAPGLAATAAALHRDAAAGSTGGGGGGVRARAHPPAVLDIRAGAVPPEAVAAWLLGYPAALMRVDPPGATDAAPVPASAPLSAATLVALCARPPRALAAALAAAGWPLPAGVVTGGREAGGDLGRVDVCSFALPAGGPPGGWLGAWEEGVRRRTDGSGWENVGVATGGMGGGGLAV